VSVCRRKPDLSTILLHKLQIATTSLSSPVYVLTHALQHERSEMIEADGIHTPRQGMPHDPDYAAGPGSDSDPCPCDWSSSFVHLIVSTPSCVNTRSPMCGTPRDSGLLRRYQGEGCTCPVSRPLTVNARLVDKRSKLYNLSLQNMFFMCSTQKRRKGNQRGRGKDNKTCPSDSSL
jgi:hypothetical protein